MTKIIALRKQNLDWVYNFEKEFEINILEKEVPYIVIEGIEPYKQSLNSKLFKVNSRGLYSYGISEIAFLVNCWAKIQDSLEMIFNLLCQSSIRSLKILSYLREKKIPSYQFAQYLYAQRKVVLINRYDSNGNSQFKGIKNMIDNLAYCHYLIVGDLAHKSIARSSVISLAKVIHPSGVNLNKNSQDYFDIWYKFDDNKCNIIKGNFTLKNFHRL